MKKKEEEIDIFRLKFLYILEQGTFNEVKLSMDTLTRTRYAQKTFRSAEDYEDEKEILKKLEEEF